MLYTAWGQLCKSQDATWHWEALFYRGIEYRSNARIALLGSSALLPIARTTGAHPALLMSYPAILTMNRMMWQTDTLFL